MIAALASLVCVGLAPAGATVGASRYGAGYFSQPASGVTSVTATFKAPPITCASPNNRETLVPGVALLNNQGEVTAIVALTAACRSGAISYSTTICLSGLKCVKAKANRGDTLVATISHVSPQTTGTIKDVTTGTVKTTTASFSPFDIYAFIGDLGPHWLGDPTAVPTFTSTKFTHAEVNGAALGGAYQSQLNLEGATDVQIKARNITPTSETFTTQFVTNY